MKKIYIVTSGSYSDYNIQGVFSTHKKAEKVANAYSDCNIEEWDVDTLFSIARKGLVRFYINMERDGEVLSSGKCGSPYNAEEEIETTAEVEQEYTHTYGYVEPAHLHVKCWARNEKHAIKIASEHLAMTIARGDWDEQGVSR